MSINRLILNLENVSAERDGFLMEKRELSKELEKTKMEVTEALRAQAGALKDALRLKDALVSHHLVPADPSLQVRAQWSWTPPVPSACLPGRWLIPLTLLLLCPPSLLHPLARSIVAHRMLSIQMIFAPLIVIK